MIRFIGALNWTGTCKLEDNIKRSEVKRTPEDLDFNLYKDLGRVAKTLK